jgi:hypothetical protein
MPARLLLCLVLLLAAGSARAEDPYPQDDALRLNHVQAIGTHNSYHLLSTLFPNGPPPVFDYEHAPLDVQLDDQGVRKFELDVYWDLDFEIFRVHHENYFDKETSCETLVLCLEILRDWSLAHRGHHPILIMIEPKGIHSEFTLSDDPICDPPDFSICHYDELDAEFRSVLAPESGTDLLITPDEVRGTHTSLREAILTDGWPTLRQTRGRFLGVMLGGLDFDGYTDGLTSLQGRALFIGSSPGRDDAAVLFRDDSVASEADIAGLAALGYVLRTRADSLDDARINDTTARDAAFASGAHYISTDFPVPEYLNNGYFVQIPAGTPSRCNPVSAIGLACTPLDIENPAALVLPEPVAALLGVASAAALAALRRRERMRLRSISS